MLRASQINMESGNRYPFKHQHLQSNASSTSNNNHTRQQQQQQQQHQQQQQQQKATTKREIGVNKIKIFVFLENNYVQSHDSQKLQKEKIK